MNGIKNEQLILAAKIGHINMVNVLLAKGANVNHADTSGNTCFNVSRYKRIFKYS